MNKKFDVLTFLLTSVMSTTALAGGYQLQEYSITNLGRSFAGAGVVGDDYSAIAFNPAGMMLKNDGLQLGDSFVGIRSDAKGRLSNADGTVLNHGNGHIKTLAPLPHFFAQKKVTDNLALGAGFYVPFGLGTYYRQKTWFASNHAVDSEIQALDGSLALSYQINDYISVGGSFILEYLDAQLTNDIFNNGQKIGYSDMKADGWEPGYNVGIMIEPVKDTRFGITYRSKITHEIKGPHKISTILGNRRGECGTTLDLPEHVLFSAYHKMGKVGLSAMARWTRWNRFNQLVIPTKASGSTVTVDEDWKNVWMIGAGVDYQLNDKWTVRAGGAWDEGAVKRSKTRTARVPDSNRIIATLGASYQTGNWQWDMAYAHLFWNNARVDNVGTDGTALNAEYKTGTDIIGLGLQYHF